ncbi:nucleoporin complex subunit 54-domain-containing protein [Paraphysoderma sedebokerense]|nr:nucleoporin complex subunit 54-domain-containing protein [Paraphysoderma sedebokerense]
MSFNFGSSSTPNKPLFGNQPTSSTPAFGAQTSSFSFGTPSTSQAQSQPQQQTSQPGFGFSTSTSQQPATTSTTGLFGQPASNTTSTSSLFKAPAPIAGSSATPGFGSGGTTGTTSFSFTNKPSTSFGTTNTGLGGGGLGSSSTLSGGLVGSFGSQPQTQSAFGMQQQPQQQQLLPQAAAPTILDKLTAVRARWDPKSPHCQFQHYFYNYIHPAERHAYGRPTGHDENLWNQAMKDNPNPECFVPALAVGFEDLKKRMEQQEQQCQIHKAKLAEITSQIRTLQDKQTLSTSTQLLEYKRTHQALSHRVLKLMKNIQILRNHNLPIRPDEEMLKARLENMIIQMKKAGVSRARVQELWSLLRMARESVESGRAEEDESWGVVDEAGLQQIFKVLSDQTTGLSHLSDIITQDQSTLGKIQKEAIEYLNSLRPNPMRTPSKSIPGSSSVSNAQPLTGTPVGGESLGRSMMGSSVMSWRN